MNSARELDSLKRRARRNSLSLSYTDLTFRLASYDNGVKCVSCKHSGQSGPENEDSIVSLCRREILPKAKKNEGVKEEITSLLRWVDIMSALGGCRKFTSAESMIASRHTFPLSASQARHFRT